MGYESFYTENPSISVVPTTHTKLNRNKASHLILLLINSGEEEVVIQKACTIALGVKSKWKIQRNSKSHYDRASLCLRWQVNKLVTHPDSDNKGLSI